MIFRAAYPTAKPCPLQAWLVRHFFLAHSWQGPSQINDGYIVASSWTSFGTRSMLLLDYPFHVQIRNSLLCPPDRLILAIIQRLCAQLSGGPCSPEMQLPSYPSLDYLGSDLYSILLNLYNADSQRSSFLAPGPDSIFLFPSTCQVPSRSILQCSSIQCRIAPELPVSLALTTAR